MVYWSKITCFMGLGIDFDGWDLKIINSFKIEPF